MGIEEEKLSPSARRLIALRPAILEEWEKRALACVAEAGSVDQPTLVNTFPYFLETIAKAMSPSYSARAEGEVLPYASEHGGIRARMGEYKPQSVVREYQLLRDTVLDALEADGVLLDRDETRIINRLFETAIREAVTAYAAVQAALKEQFVAALAHDLRTPLAAANTAAEIILRTADSPRLQELARRIRDNHSRIDKMVKDLIDTIVFHARERLDLDLSHFDMQELVHEICSHFVAADGRKVEIEIETETETETETDGSPTNGCWSRDALGRALENLVGNAVKFAYPDTPIRIRISSRNQRINVSVHNIGPTIPVEEQEGIFQIFNRASTKGGSQGWGIGLPYARVAIESHGGSLLVDSDELRGTTFMADLPLDSRPYRNAPGTR